MAASSLTPSQQLGLLVSHSLHFCARCAFRHVGVADSTTPLAALAELAAAAAAAASGASPTPAPPPAAPPPWPCTACAGVLCGAVAASERLSHFEGQRLLHRRGRTPLVVSEYRRELRQVWLGAEGQRAQYPTLLSRTSLILGARVADARPDHALPSP